MGRRISMATRRELLSAVKERYRRENRKGKSRIIDEFVAVTGYHRKHALRLLNQSEKEPSERVGRRIYDEAVREALILLWETADRICGKRLKAALLRLIESMERHGYLDLDSELRNRLMTISAATIDRLLAPVREKGGRRRRRGGAQSSIRKQVPIRTFGDWKDPKPGFFEGDLVAHCGGTMAGSFVHTFTLTDIASGWTENIPLLVREQGLVTEALDVFRKRLPVALRGLDTDNDSVFINEVMVEYCDRHDIELTRCRPYRKNDQAWVEEKNGSVVRRLVGYERLSGIAATRILSRLFGTARLYVNFFQPSFKLREKTRDGAKVTRKYFPPATPCERLLEHPDVSPVAKEALRELRAELDPVALLKEIREAQAELGDLVSGRTCEQPDLDLQQFLAGLPDLWLQGEARPTHKKPPAKVRDWRTRADPFEGIWMEAQKWLEQEPDITGKALFDRIRANYPGEFAPGQLRTLQRRIREWRQTMAKRLLGVHELGQDLEPAIMFVAAGSERTTRPQGERKDYES